MFFKMFSTVVATSLVVACGIGHGLITDRWQPPVETREAAERLATIPLTIGEWQGEAIEQKATRREAGIAGSVQLRYVNQRTGQAILLAMICGRPGPVSIHTPDACYTASGFQVGTPSRAEVPHKEGSFWLADAVRTRASEETRVRIYWAWNTPEGWTASQNPRMEFAPRHVLHKLYVLRELENLDEASEADPCLSFMEVLLPELDRVLFSKAEVK